MRLHTGSNPSDSGVVVEEPGACEVVELGVVVGNGSGVVVLLVGIGGNEVVLLVGACVVELVTGGASVVVVVHGAGVVVLLVPRGAGEVVLLTVVLVLVGAHVQSKGYSGGAGFGMVLSQDGFSPPHAAP